MRRASWVGLVLLLVLAAGLRLYHLGAPFHETVCARLGWSHLPDPGMWVDEAYTYETARHSPAELLDVVTHLDRSPPLYYLLLWVWLKLGTSDFWARLSSALCSLGIVMLTGLLARRLGGVRAGLLAVAACAVSLYQVQLGQELRMYPLVTLLGLVATWLFMVAGDRKVWWIAYAAVAAAILWTHYLGALLLLAHGVEALCRGRGRAWALSMAGAGATLLPWLPFFLQQLHIHNPPGARDVVGAVVAFGTFALGYNLPLPLPVLLLAGLTVVVVGLGFARRGADPRLMAGCLLLPPLLLLLLSLRNPDIFSGRYLMPSSPFLWITLAVWAAGSERWGKAFVSLLGVLLLLNGWGNFYRATTPEARVSEFPLVISLLEANQADGDVLLVQSRGAWWPVLHYYHGPMEAQVVPSGAPSDWLAVRTGSARRVWLLSCSPQIDDAQGVAWHWLESHFRAGPGLQSPGSMPVTLFLFTRR